MRSKRGLERVLSELDGFDDPRVELEQYPTPADVAASVLHEASLRGDVADRDVVDLGAGTGILALAAALSGARRVVGVELDPVALGAARRNQRRLDLRAPVDWIRGDATQAPLCPDEPTTVVMNPPFGAQRGNVHADRAFLETTARIADVSYSIHNADSGQFVEAFAADTGGRITHAYASTLSMDRQFAFHREASRAIQIEVYRIEWRPDRRR